MFGFDGAQRGNYFRGEQIKRLEVGVRMRKLKNGNTAGKDEVTRKMIKVEVTGWWTGFGGNLI